MFRATAIITRFLYFETVYNDTFLTKNTQEDNTEVINKSYLYLT